MTDNETRNRAILEAYNRHEKWTDMSARFGLSPSKMLRTLKAMAASGVNVNWRHERGLSRRRPQAERNEGIRRDYLDGMPVQAIAAKWGVKPGTAYEVIKRARQNGDAIPYRRACHQVAGKRSEG